MKNNIKDRELLLALDISTRNIGYVVIDLNNNKLIEIDYIPLTIPKNTNDNDKDMLKAELVENYIWEHFHIKRKYKFNHIAIEEPLANTGININTTAMLLGFNAQCKYIFKVHYNTTPQMIKVHDARKHFLPEFVEERRSNKTVLSFPKGWKSKEKKHYIWEKVNSLEPHLKDKWEYNRNNKLRDTNYDMTDAYCIAKYYIEISHNNK